ncbi:hypothetical protein [Winogradskya humida]|uniref:Uncharacterized protein n=1 Tax=Winogradskya humida TaxID=113566 RepID=A0ABQ4A524_9ACTN|nr:hypothetical protein [Actinoplanes humidus]GIE25839.1 hypothetical protein Ahu01nite_089410 [Actinoplanes humidus]
MPGIREYAGTGTGTRVIHTGGRHASYLQLPLQTPAEAQQWVRPAGADNAFLREHLERSARASTGRP